MTEVEAADRRRWQHREAVGQFQSDGLFGTEQIEQGALDAVFRARGISRRGADAAILFADQRFVGQLLVRRIAPERGADLLVDELRERLQTYTRWDEKKLG